VKGNFEGRVVGLLRSRKPVRADKPAAAGTTKRLAPAGAVDVVREGLLSYWPFEEGQGEVAACAAGGKAAKLHGPAWTDGVKGGALAFDGKDDYARTEFNEKLLLGRGDFTLEAWVSTGGLNSMRLVGNRMYGSSNGYDLSISEGKPTAMAMERGRAHQYVQARTYVADTDWHQIVGVRKGDSISIYVDGALDRSVARPACDISPPDRSPEPTWFGMARMDPEPMNAFQGAIDEVRFYDRALSADQVNQNYQATRE